MKSTVETKIIELVKLGHELAKELHCAESAALVSDLASQLEVQLVRSNALAAENAGLKRAAEFATASDMWEDLGCDVYRYQYIDWYVDGLKAAMETPATSAFLAEVRELARNELIDELEARFTKLSQTSPTSELRSGAAGAAAFISTFRKGVQS